MPIINHLAPMARRLIARVNQPVGRFIAAVGLYVVALKVILPAVSDYFKTPVFLDDDATKIRGAVTTSVLTVPSIGFYSYLLESPQDSVARCFVDAMALTTPGIIEVVTEGEFEMQKMSSEYVLARFFLRETLTMAISPCCHHNQLCLALVRIGSAGVAAGTLKFVESVFDPQKDVSLGSLVMVAAQKSYNKGCYAVLENTGLGQGMTLLVSFSIEVNDAYFIPSCTSVYSSLVSFSSSFFSKEEQQPALDLEICYDDYYKIFSNSNEVCYATELDLA